MTTKQKEICNIIETLPDELANQVIDFIEYLKFSHISMEAPDSVVIKSKKDLKEKLKKGLDDIDAGRVYTLDEVFDKLDTI